MADEKLSASCPILRKLTNPLKDGNFTIFLQENEAL